MTNDDPNQTELIDSYPRHETPEPPPPPRRIAGMPNDRTSSPTEFDVTLVGHHEHIVGYSGPKHDADEDIRLRIALIDWGRRPILFECSFLGRLLWVKPGEAYANPTDEQCAGALHATEGHAASRRWFIREFGEPLPTEAEQHRAEVLRHVGEHSGGALGASLASATAELMSALKLPPSDPYDDLPGSVSDALQAFEQALTEVVLSDGLSDEDYLEQLYKARRDLVRALEEHYDPEPDSSRLD